MNTTLLDTLKQSKVDANESPALALGGTPFARRSYLSRAKRSSISDTDFKPIFRGLFLQIRRWIKTIVNDIIRAVEEIAKDIERSIFVALTLPGFVISDLGLTTILNISNGGVSTAQDQE